MQDLLPVHGQQDQGAALPERSSTQVRGRFPARETGLLHDLGGYGSGVGLRLDRGEVADGVAVVFPLLLQDHVEA